MLANNSQMGNAAHLFAVWHPEIAASIANKINRGEFAATFFLPCLATLELDGIRLEDI